MGICILCGEEAAYSDSYSGFMTLRRLACDATSLYLLDLASKPPAKRAQQIISVRGVDDMGQLDTITTEVIECALKSTSDVIKDGRVDDSMHDAMMWRRHQVFADLGLSGLIDLVYHSDSDGYYTVGMATDILAWWARVNSFYVQAVAQFVSSLPSNRDMQERMDSIAKRVCTGVRVIVGRNEDGDIRSRYAASMDHLIAVFHEVVKTETVACIC